MATRPNIQLPIPEAELVQINVTLGHDYAEPHRYAYAINLDNAPRYPRWYVQNLHDLRCSKRDYSTAAGAFAALIEGRIQWEDDD